MEITLKAIWVFTSKGNNLLGKAITRITEPKEWKSEDVPTHAGVVMVYSNSIVTYTEAFLGEDWAMDLNISKLKSYAKQDGCWVKVFNVFPLTQAQLDYVYCTSRVYTKLWHYSIMQLFRMLRKRMFGWSIPQTPTSVVCSEAVARLLHPVVPLLWQDAGQPVENIAPVDLLVAAKKLDLPILSLEEMLASVEFQ